MDVSQLTEWVALSRDAEGRHEVIRELDSDNGVLHLANSLIDDISKASQNSEDTAPHVENLIIALQVIRNVCAAGPDVCQQLQTLGLISTLSSTLDLVTTATAELNWRLPAVAAQVIANACVGRAEFATAAWPVIFPTHLLVLSHIRSGSAPVVAAFILLTCCKQVEGALDQLLTPDGGEVLSALLCGHVHIQKEGGSNDNVGLLASYLSFQQDRLQDTYTCLNNSSENNTVLKDPNTPQVLLLQELAAEAQEIPNTTDTTIPTTSTTNNIDGAQQQRGKSMAFLLHTIESLAHKAHSIERTTTATPEVEEVEKQPQQQQLSEGNQQLLQDCLQLLRDIAARDDDGAALSGGCSLVNELLELDVVTLLLAMLKALPPPRPSSSYTTVHVNNNTTTTNDNRNGSGNGSSTTSFQSKEQQHKKDKQALEGVAPLLTTKSSTLPTKQPYYGYRTDVLSILANLAHRRPPVQNRVNSLSAEPLLLAQCQVDHESPMSREWGLWALRNVCEGSEEGRQALSELKAVAAEDNDELKKAGLRVSLDEESGKLKVQKRYE